jgi:hypothetical protein
MSVKMFDELLSIARVGNGERLVRSWRDDFLTIFPKEFRMPAGYERINCIYSNSIQRLEVEIERFRVAKAIVEFIYLF